MTVLETRLDRIERAIQNIGARLTYDVVRGGYGDESSYVSTLNNELTEILFEMDEARDTPPLQYISPPDFSDGIWRAPEAAE